MRETWSSSDEMKCVWLGFSCKPNNYYLGSVIWAGISIIWLSVDSTGLVTAGHVAPLGHMHAQHAGLYFERYPLPLVAVCPCWARI